MKTVFPSYRQMAAGRGEGCVLTWRFRPSIRRSAIKLKGLNSVFLNGTAYKLYFTTMISPPAKPIPPLPRVPYRHCCRPIYIGISYEVGQPSARVGSIWVVNHTETRASSFLSESRSASTTRSASSDVFFPTTDELAQGATGASFLLFGLSDLAFKRKLCCSQTQVGCGNVGRARGLQR